jgi:hypothetical protein
VLSTLLESKSPAFQNVSITALVRGEDRARTLTEKGVQVELFENLEQTELLEKLAANYDGKYPVVRGKAIADVAFSGCVMYHWLPCQISNGLHSWTG